MTSSNQAKKLNFEIKSVMEIARLKLDEDEKNLIEKQLLQIFEHFSEIQRLELKESIDVQGFSFAYTDKDSLMFRKDAVMVSDSSGLIISQFTNNSERFLKVPKSVD
ncbi:MAG: hypothetical protein N3E37_04730 [Candidatus Micrarchaeota archaeon]|nr:hypothetical protein [Candidatus Micrarchaeota archaeon]